MWRLCNTVVLKNAVRRQAQVQTGRNRGSTKLEQKTDMTHSHSCPPRAFLRANVVLKRWLVLIASPLGKPLFNISMWFSFVVDQRRTCRIGMR